MYKYIAATDQSLPGAKHQVLLCRKTREFLPGFEGQSTPDLLGDSHSLTLLKVRNNKGKSSSELRKSLQDSGTTFAPIRDGNFIPYLPKHFCRCVSFSL